jgi:hypothetical protein
MTKKRERTQAHIDASLRYQKTVKRIIVTWKQDDIALEWLRSQVTSDSEIPSFIREMVRGEQIRRSSNSHD